MLQKKKYIWLGCAAAIALVICLIIFYPLYKSTHSSVPVTEEVPEETVENEETDPEENYLFTVCIDAGHGGKDRGSDSKGRIEKNDCIKIAKAVSESLQKENNDIQVILTRDDDATLSLEERCQIANEANADYMVSIHRNKGKGYGVETWISKSASAESIALANSVMDELDSIGISRNRGVKIGSQSSKNEDYYINHHSQMPSCLIELGFINNSDDNALFDRNISRYASAISGAILETYDTFHTQNPQVQYMQENNLSDYNEAIPTINIASEDTDEYRQQITLFGMKLRTNHVPSDQLNQLPNTSIEFMQGLATADRNRPALCLENEASFADYNAHFIGTNLMTEEGKKILHLTFNERYEYGYTEKELDLLKEHNIKATFFVTLDYAKKNPTIIRRILNEGHILGNLGSTNPDGGMPALSIQKQSSEILANHTYIKKHYHYSMYLFRFPAGIYSEQSLAVVNNHNYQSLFWSFGYTDYDVKHQPDPDDALNKMISKLHPGAVYLMRGESETNSAIMEDFINKAEALGYQFCLF